MAKREWLGRCVAGLLMATAIPVSAQSLPAEDPAFAAAVTDLLDTAITEQTVFLNCSVTYTSRGNTMMESWTKDAVDTGQRLFELGFDAAYVTDFANRASLASIMKYDDTFYTVISFCAGNADWERRYSMFDFVKLPYALESIELPGTGPGKPLTPGKLDGTF